MTASSESVLTFAVAGIFGAGRLASRLKELESVDLIWAVACGLHAYGNSNTVQQSSRCESGIE